MTDQATPAKVRLTDGLGPNVPERESVDDALLIVGTYGPWGADLNDAHRRQVVLADEVLKLQDEQSVLVRLLIEADKVLSTLEGESSDEQELLDSLRRRTWKNLPGARSVKLSDTVGVKHNALADAFSQATAAAEIHKALFAAKKVKV